MSVSKLQIFIFKSLILLGLFGFISCSDDPETAVPGRLPIQNNKQPVTDSPNQTGDESDEDELSARKYIKYDGFSISFGSKKECDLFLSVDANDDISIYTNMKIHGHLTHEGEADFFEYDDQMQVFHDLNSGYTPALLNFEVTQRTKPSGVPDLGLLRSDRNAYKKPILEQAIRVNLENTSDTQKFAKAIRDAIRDNSVGKAARKKILREVTEIGVTILHGDHYHDEVCQKVDLYESSLVELEHDDHGHEH